MENLKKLSRTQMKNVLGGVATGNCGYSCNGHYSTYTFSKAEAQAQQQQNIQNGCTTSTWCCSSCP